MGSLQEPGRNQLWTERQKRRGREWIGMERAQLSRGQTNAACCCLLVPLQDKKWKEKLPKHIQKFLAEEAKKKTEPMEEKKRKRRSVAATKAKTGRKKETPESQVL